VILEGITKVLSAAKSSAISLQDLNKNAML